MDFLLDQVSDRKCRLFACACCRRILHLLQGVRGVEAVEVAERYTDGLGSREELRAAEQEAIKGRDEAWAAYEASGREDDSHCVASSAAITCGWAACQPDSYTRNDDLGCRGLFAAAYAAGTMAHHTSGKGDSLHADYKLHKAKEACVQAVLLRDILGNPFRPVAVAPSWLAWNSSTVSRIAQAIYDERAFERMPILADALEDSGCDNADILAHCRGDGPHVRGCWVVDLLLGKK